MPTTRTGPIAAELRLLRVVPVLEAMQRVEGWFSMEEGDLLAAAAADAIRRSAPPRRLLEVGSYCGRSTVVLGMVVRALGDPSDVVHAVDPHQGVVGAVGNGLWSGEPTLDRFRRTLRDAGIEDVVVPRVVRFADLEWDVDSDGRAVLALLDGLHDYASVLADITRLDPLLADGALLACHDYGQGYEGVRTAVDQVLGTGCYELVARAGSLVVLVRRLALDVPALDRIVDACVDVPGWYSRDELAFLAWTAARLRAGDEGRDLTIVEVGCHHGRATGVLAGVARERSPGCVVHVVDPFDGVVGGVGEGLWETGPGAYRVADG